jgi:hypothetical protein
LFSKFFYFSHLELILMMVIDGGNIMTFSQIKIKKMIVYLWRNALESSKDVAKTMAQPHKFYSSLKGSFFLDNLGINCLNELLNELRKDENISEKFSNKYLEELINDLIIELLPVNSMVITVEIEKKFSQLLIKLSQPEIDWLVIIPVTNLEIRAKSFNVGSVRFSKFAKTTGKRILAKIKIAQKSFFKVSVLSKYTNSTVASVHVLAVDETRANELAVIMINDSLDILRFYRLDPQLRYDKLGINNIGTVGRIHKGSAVVLCLSSPPKFSSIIPFFEHTGFQVPFEITKQNQKIFFKHGFKSLHNILKKKESNRTDLEKRLLSGVHFCSLSTTDESITNSFVNSIISLEAILIKGMEQKSGNIAERVALIIGNNLISKKWFFKEMIRLYRIRSNIVHSGNLDVTTSDLSLLQIINYLLIVMLIQLSKKRNFTSISDLINWCTCQKFS